NCTDKKTGQVQSAICRTAGNGTNGPCDCWAYSVTTVAGGGAFDGTVGHVDLSGNGCFCPTTSDPTWQ
ncbi:MAG TPA: hypothetical protein VF945_19670, partial [Polyangia bacterium]